MNVRTFSLPTGETVTVSSDDWQRVSKIAWSSNGRYVRGRWRKSTGGTGKTVFLHRFVMSAPSGLVVDHIDDNPLNNTRENLQITTIARNVMRSRSGGVTRYNGRWRVRKRVDGHMMSFGLFDTREGADAALAAAMRLIWDDPSINRLGTVL